MACPHKFREYLTLERLDFEPTTLIVGTFNPAWPEENYAEWFYGRTDNNYFWDVLPRIYVKPGLRNKSAATWKQFCKHNRIAITDLVSCIDDADPANEKHRDILGKYTDSKLGSKFKRQAPNHIVPLLKSFPSINNVYLTTTINSGLWQKLWLPVSTYCNQNGKWNQQLMTPSKGARFEMTKGSGIKMPDFIYDDWVHKWHRLSA